MEKFVAWAQRGQGTQHKVMLCAKSPPPTPLRHLSRSTTPHVTGPFPSHPTHSCSQNPQSFIRAKTSPKYGACGANAAWRATKTLPGLQQQQVANALGKNTKNWTSIEQPPARYSLSASSSLGTSESPVSYEEVSQAKKAQGLWKWSVCRTPKILCIPALCAHNTSYPAKHPKKKVWGLLEPAALHSWFIEHSTSLLNTILSTSALPSFFNHCQLLLCWRDTKHLYRLLQGRNVTARNLVQQDSSQMCPHIQCYLQKYGMGNMGKKIGMCSIPYSKDRVFSELTPEH